VYLKSFKNDTDNQLHNCVCGARCLSRWRCYKYTCKITTEKNDLSKRSSKRTYTYKIVYPNVHTLIKSMLTTSCTTASVERDVYQDGGDMYSLAMSLPM